jgi:hypothetical protein
MTTRKLVTGIGITAALGLGLSACGSSGPVTHIESGVKSQVQRQTVGVYQVTKVTCSPLPAASTLLCTAVGHSDGGYDGAPAGTFISVIARETVTYATDGSWTGTFNYLKRY